MHFTGGLKQLFAIEQPDNFGGFFLAGHLDKAFGKEPPLENENSPDGSVARKPLIHGFVADLQLSRVINAHEQHA